MTTGFKRLAVFGGAFDPPHVAHVEIARAAIEQLSLDELRVFPTGQAWHKPTTLSAPAHRLAMTRIAFEDVPLAVIDDRELRRPGPTYTIDTLRELKAEQPAAQLFLIMGEDQAASLTRWHEWESILGLSTLCVASRPSALAEMSSRAVALPAQAELQWLQLPPMSESATDIRSRTLQKMAIAHLVPAGVSRYIDQHHLYQTP